MTFSSRRIALVSGAIVLAGLPWMAAGSAPVTPGATRAAPLAAPQPHPAVVRTERTPAAPAPYWTRARMENARDMTSGAAGASAAGGISTATGASAAGVSIGAGTASGLGARWGWDGAVARSTGRVFLTLNGTDYSCSGSAVVSANASVVATAAHCVSDGAGRWATHWIFVPGYHDGHRPYGSFPARKYFAAAGWQHGADEDDDIAFVVVSPARVHGTVRALTDAVGGQQIAFGRRDTLQTVFGYPSDPPYNGRQLDYCGGLLLPDPYGAADAGLECTMTEGSSGGPWFSGFDSRTGRGTITGVTAFRYKGNSLTLFSANLGATAKALYEKAQHVAAPHVRAQHANAPHANAPHAKVPHAKVPHA
ncbi:MAG: trypsin-like serine protease [Actinomycetota bacterium]|nr:trypsin-like serine protease [Actinomycetota bacterium]